MFFKVSVTIVTSSSLLLDRYYELFDNIKMNFSILKVEILQVLCLECVFVMNQQSKSYSNMEKNIVPNIENNPTSVGELQNGQFGKNGRPFCTLLKIVYCRCS